MRDFDYKRTYIHANHMTDPEEINRDLHFRYGHISAQEFNESAEGQSDAKSFSKLKALPSSVRALVKAIYHSAGAVFNGIPTACMGDTRAIKGSSFYLARDVQELYGSLLLVFNRKLGSYHIAEAKMQKEFYDKYFSYNAPLGLGLSKQMNEYRSEASIVHLVENFMSEENSSHKFDDIYKKLFSMKSSKTKDALCFRLAEHQFVKNNESNSLKALDLTKPSYLNLILGRPLAEKLMDKFVEQKDFQNIKSAGLKLTEDTYNEKVHELFELLASEGKIDEIVGLSYFVRDSEKGAEYYMEKVRYLISKGAVGKIPDDYSLTGALRNEANLEIALALTHSRKEYLSNAIRSLDSEKDAENIYKLAVKYAPDLNDTELDEFVLKYVKDKVGLYFTEKYPGENLDDFTLEIEGLKESFYSAYREQLKESIRNNSPVPNEFERDLFECDLFRGRPPRPGPGFVYNVVGSFYTFGFNEFEIGKWVTKEEYAKMKDHFNVDNDDYEEDADEVTIPMLSPDIIRDKNINPLLLKYFNLIQAYSSGEEYKLFNLPADATKEDFNHAWKKLSLKIHPDKFAANIEVDSPEEIEQKKIDKEVASQIFAFLTSIKSKKMEEIEE